MNQATKTQTISAQCQKAAAHTMPLGNASTQKKNDALHKLAELLVANTDEILRENHLDVEESRKQGVSAALIDRLTLTKERITAISNSVIDIEKEADPIGEIIHGWRRPNGLVIQKVRVPLGVIGMIYEARPNVTVDAIGLAIKTGNCVILRGSSSAYNSNRILASLGQAALEFVGLPKDAIQLLDDTSREGVIELCKMKTYLDLIIPRGGAGLIQNVIQHATVPTIETGVGNCHIYVDKEANLTQALAIIENAKVQRPSVCNSCETVLIHQDVAKEFVPKLVTMLQTRSVEIRACEITRKIDPSLKAATDEDWDTEFLDLILAVKTVSSIDEAISHIQQHGTKHSEAIISTDLPAITAFKQNVDAAAILINASTRFVDGGEFGFGAEIGISTQKLHARGPMGLTELTTIKYIVEGSGQIRG